MQRLRHHAVEWQRANVGIPQQIVFPLSYCQDTGFLSEPLLVNVNGSQN